MSTESQERDNTVRCGVSEGFSRWLPQAGGSLAVSTYQAGKVAMIGWDGHQVTLLMRDFPKPLGLGVQGDRLALVTRHELLQFANAAPLAYDYLEEQPGRYDALYLPRVSHFTGDLHIHDVAYGVDGLYLVNTRFSCLARLSDTYSFEPIWRPSFITDMVPEDRCHLNGLAMLDGRPKYVTALGETDVVGGWRENKAAGGVIIDVTTGETVARGFSMPHSPRWYKQQLWVLNSGRGELLIVNPQDGRTMVVCRLPGYLRGLSFVGPYALVGMSHIREKHIFGGLPIQQMVDKLMCGVAVVDLRSGAVEGIFEFTAGCTELYDVQFLSGKRQPMILNSEKKAVLEAVTNPDSSFWLRPSKEIPPQEAPRAQDVSPTDSAPWEGDDPTSSDDSAVTMGTEA